MAAFIAKFVGKKILGETLENKFGQEDPYFESVPATRLDGKKSKKGSKSKVKRRRKALPPGLSDHDAQVLTKVKRRAYRLDMSLFTLAGVSFGWGSVIGIFPVVGDVIDALLALMVFKTCMAAEGGLPNALKIKMIFNIFFDFLLGLVPFIGDLADAMFRANTRNVILFEEHLRKQGAAYLRQSGQPMPAVDPSDPVEFDRNERRRAADGSSNPNSRQSSPQPARQPQRSRSHSPLPRQPEPVETRASRGWFSRSKQAPVDVETGRNGNGASVDRRESRRSRR